MAAPNPSDFKNLIPGATSSLCEKINKLAVQLTTKVYEAVAFEWNDSGDDFTDQFKTLVCAAYGECNGGSGGGGGGSNPDNPNMPIPTGVSASDGTFSSKVRIVWNAVVPPTGQGAVTNYYVYRSSSTNTDPTAGSTLIGTIAAGTYLYDDTTVIAGTTYNYWVRATNGIETSAYAGYDAGYASTATVTLPSVTDLKATQGFELSTGFVRLVATVPSGTTSVDVYRNTTNDSGTAVLIHADVVWTDTTSAEPVPATGVAFDNMDEIVVYDDPPSDTIKYWYWLKVKKIAPPEISGFSNSAEGWVQLGAGDTGLVAPAQISVHGDTFVVPPGKTRMRVLMVAGGGAGSGASTFWAAPGGSGGHVLLAEVVVVPGQTYTYTSFFEENPSSGFGVTPPLTATDEYEGKSGQLSNGAGHVLKVVGGYSGIFSGSGTSSHTPARPLTGTGITGGSTIASAIYAGAYGERAYGSRGGRGGHSFGFVRNAPANYLAGSFDGTTVNQRGGGGGSSVGGSYDGGSNSEPLVYYSFAD